MVPRKILWLWILLDGDDSYSFFGFAIVTILFFEATRLVVVANIQVIVLLDSVSFKFLSNHPKKKKLGLPLRLVIKLQIYSIESR